MNKVIDKGFRSCRFVSTIVKHPVYLGAYSCVNFPMSSMELQQLLQLEAILFALRRQDNF